MFKWVTVIFQNVHKIAQIIPLDQVLFEKIISHSGTQDFSTIYETLFNTTKSSVEYFL